ncbi:uncharacterized protein LOC112480016 isoform X2 [Pteropus alecto]|uniref:uncharacterized protein LOC112480016 isoform X2 n=1 Tax=Pteropus alecto TaxID=9402 RepID=UPI000D536A6E|nr:uncharacterized protein LOC112480016 isoform X2 [Pteropus alecto]
MAGMVLEESHVDEKWDISKPKCSHQPHVLRPLVVSLGGFPRPTDNAEGPELCHPRVPDRGTVGDRRKFGCLAGQVGLVRFSCTNAQSRRSALNRHPTVRWAPNHPCYQEWEGTLSSTFRNFSRPPRSPPDDRTGRGNRTKSSPAPVNGFGGPCSRDGRPRPALPNTPSRTLGMTSRDPLNLCSSPSAWSGSR